MKQTNAATPKQTPQPTPKPVTKEMIQLVLNSISTEDLEKFRLEKLTAALQPLKDEYMELTAKQNATLNSILAIEPNWEPPKPATVKERILAFITENEGEHTKAAIGDAVGSKFVSVALSALVKGNKVTFKGDKYSAVTE